MAERTLLSVPEDDLKFEVARLELKPGDVLAARVDRIVTSEAGERLRAYIQRQLPEGCRVVVLGPEISLSVVARAELERAAKGK